MRESNWTCPICGKPGKRTHEHVFGKWLSKLLGVSNHPVALFSTKGGRLWASRGLGTVVEVCDTCNSGWMSALEGRFQRAFGRAILGHPGTFSETDLTILAHWAALKAITLQPHLAGLHEETHVPIGHMASLPLGTPPGTRVWLGAYTPVTRYVYWQQAPMELNRPPSGDSRWNGYVKLMTIGHLMLVVLGLDAENGDDFTVAGLPNGVFRPVWPPIGGSIEWPQPGALILNDRGIATFWPPKDGQLIAYGSR
jgi:hypothetical protein